MPEQQDIEWKESWRDEYLKWVCGFANAQGGSIHIGVDDDGKVVGVGNAKKLLEDLPNKVSQQLGLTVEVNLVPKDGKDTLEIQVQPSSVAVSLRGRYYFRSGSVKKELTGTALNDFLLRKAGLTWDAVVEERASLDDMDAGAVQLFARDAGKAGRLPDLSGLDTSEILEKLHLLEDGTPKRAAVVLFAKDPAKFYQGVSLRLGRFVQDETDLRFQEVIEGNLVQSLPILLEALEKKFFVKQVEFEGFYRRESWPYPVVSLREAFLNAMVHKDYASGIHIQCKVFNDQLTLWNPGGLPGNLTIKDLKAFHTSQPRNRLIADVCYKAGYIDSWGRGIGKILEGCKEAGLAEPEFAELQGGVLVTFSPGKAESGAESEVSKQAELESVAESVAESGAESLRGRTFGILLEGQQSKAEIANQLNMRNVTGALNRTISAMVEEGLIEYTIPEKPQSRLQKYRLTEKGRKSIEK